jgi:hypothetical protein
MTMQGLPLETLHGKKGYSLVFHPELQLGLLLKSLAGQ